jgi:hypothetical protein
MADRPCSRPPDLPSAQTSLDQLLLGTACSRLAILTNVWDWPFPFLSPCHVLSRDRREVVIVEFNRTLSSRVAHVGRYACMLQGICASWTCNNRARGALTHGGRGWSREIERPMDGKSCQDPGCKEVMYLFLCACC